MNLHNVRQPWQTVIVCLGFYIPAIAFAILSFLSAQNLYTPVFLAQTHEQARPLALTIIYFSQAVLAFALKPIPQAEDIPTAAGMLFLTGVLSGVGCLVVGKPRDVIPSGVLVLYTALWLDLVRHQRVQHLITKL